MTIQNVVCSAAALVAMQWAVVAAGGEATTRPGPSSSSPNRGIGRISAEVQQTLRREALATSAEDREVSIRRLVRLHQEIVAHPKLARSQALQRTGLRLRARLRRVASELRDAIADASRRLPGQPANRRRGSLAKPRSTFLAQQPVVNRQPPRAAMGPPLRGQPLPLNRGPQLVALIESTISPGIWDVNGGPATIRYYAPLQAMVVRAPNNVHGDVIQLINGLRVAR